MRLQCFGIGKVILTKLNGHRINKDILFILLNRLQIPFAILSGKLFHVEVLLHIDFYGTWKHSEHWTEYLRWSIKLRVAKPDFRTHDTFQPIEFRSTLESTSNGN